jgi:hypothetical protein
VHACRSARSGSRGCPLRCASWSNRRPRQGEAVSGGDDMIVAATVPDPDGGINAPAGSCRGPGMVDGRTARPITAAAAGPRMDTCPFRRTNRAARAVDDSVHANIVSAGYGK